MSPTTLLDGNRRWVQDRTRHDPEFFARSAREHRPAVFYLGCSDARVPANLVTTADVGEMFVHRNVANQVLHDDASLTAGLAYGVGVLGINEIVVCGHRGCGGVRAAIAGGAPSEVEPWISPLRRLAERDCGHLDHLHEDARVDELARRNVIEQLRTLATHPTVRAAWDAGRPLRVHGWMYDLPSGLLRPLCRVEAGGRWSVESTSDVELAGVPTSM
jgi:carbonic anhydrase